MDASQDWIDVLRVAVKRSSSRQVARQLGVSVSSVSMALSAPRGFALASAKS